jgi:hypothetical protein
MRTPAAPPESPTSLVGVVREWWDRRRAQLPASGTFAGASSGQPVMARTSLSGSPACSTSSTTGGACAGRERRSIMGSRDAVRGIRMTVSYRIRRYPRAVPGPWLATGVGAETSHTNNGAGPPSVDGSPARRRDRALPCLHSGRAPAGARRRVADFVGAVSRCRRRRCTRRGGRTRRRAIGPSPVGRHPSRPRFVPGAPCRASDRSPRGTRGRTRRVE